MSRALFHASADDGFDLFIGHAVNRVHDLYDLDGETALLRRDGRLETMALDDLNDWGRP